MSDEGVNTVQFKGRLRLPDDTGGGIPVDLRIDDIFLVLVAEGETLGEWRMDDVGIERVFSNQFLLDLEGEAMVFVADDPLGFAYEGVAEIEAISKRLDKRWRSRKKKKRGGPSATVVDADRVDAGRAKERRTAAAEAPSAVESTPAPTAEPVESEQPAAPAEVPPPAPAWGEPVETPEPEPVVVEPSPVLPVPEPPAIESEVVPTVPEPVGWTAEPAETEPLDAAPTVEIAVETAEEEEPLPEFAAADETGDIDLPTVYTEPEYEVEEIVVPAATSAFAVVEETRAQPEPAPVEVEDDGFVAVEPVSPPVASPAEVAHLSEIPVPAEVDELPEIGAGLVDNVEPFEPTPEVDTSHEEPASGLRAAAAAARAATEEEVVDEAPVDDGAMDDAAPKHLRERKESRRTRVRRRRKPDVVEHEHTYEEKSAVGGIIRRVCSQCGHVSFGSEDVYEDWGA